MNNAINKVTFYKLKSLLSGLSKMYLICENVIIVVNIYSQGKNIFI